MRINRNIKSMKASLIREVHNKKRPSSINLGLGQPSIKVSSDIIDSAISKMKKGNMGYTLNAGMTDLRESIASHYNFPSKQGRERYCNLWSSRSNICCYGQFVGAK